MLDVLYWLWLALCGLLTISGIISLWRTWSGAEGAERDRREREHRHSVASEMVFAMICHDKVPWVMEIEEVPLGPGEGGDVGVRPLPPA